MSRGLLWILVLCLVVRPIPFGKPDEARAQGPALAGAGGTAVIVLQGLGVVTLPAWFVPAALTTVGTAAVAGVIYAACPGSTADEKGRRIHDFFVRVGESLQPGNPDVERARKLTMRMAPVATVTACPARPEAGRAAMIQAAVGAIAPDRMYMSEDPPPLLDAGDAEAKPTEPQRKVPPRGKARTARSGASPAFIDAVLDDILGKK